MQQFPVSPRSIVETVELSTRVAQLVERSGAPACAASFFAETVTVLGALQLESRVLRSPAEAGAVVRRATTGTAAHFERGGVVVSLGLPSNDAVFRDAGPTTILNRNLRIFLAGFAHAGVHASYFGRECIALRREPVGLVGLDVSATGVVLIEVWASLSGSFALPSTLTTDLEATCDRYRGRTPVDLGKAGAEPSAFAAKVLAGMAERMGVGLERAPEAARAAPSRPEDVALLEPDAIVATPAAIPIGFLDIATSGPKTFVGGDMLGPKHALGWNAAPTPPHDLPLVGATWDDITKATRVR